jgi:hypothetical protein
MTPLAREYTREIVIEEFDKIQSNDIEKINANPPAPFIAAQYTRTKNVARVEYLTTNFLRTQIIADKFKAANHEDLLSSLCGDEYFRRVILRTFGITVVFKYADTNSKIVVTDTFTSKTCK